AMAITDMLTRPKPNAAMNRSTALGSPCLVLDSACLGDGFGLLRRHLSGLDLVALVVIGDPDVPRHGVVVRIKAVLSAGADELDRLAGFDRRDSVLICVDDHSSAGAV